MSPASSAAASEKASSGSACDWEQFRSDAHKAIDFIADYYKRLALHGGLGESTMPSTTSVNGSWDACSRSILCPAVAESTVERVLEDVERYIVPGLVPWQHAGFMAQLPLAVTPASLLGNLLGNGLGVPCYNRSASPAATELELCVCDAVAEAMQLPHSFRWFSPECGSSSATVGGGVLMHSSCDGILAAMHAAKSRTLRHNTSIFTVGKRHQLSGKLVCYCSDQAHMSVERCASFLGFEHFRCLPTVCNSLGNFALSAELLEERMVEDISRGLLPCMVVANLGASGCGSIDPIDEIAEVAHRHGAWVNVDAAYGGAALLLPDFHAQVGDLRRMDSMHINGSKWLGLHCSASTFFFFADRHAVSDSLNVNSPGASSAERSSRDAMSVDLMDYQLHTKRTFPALEAFVALRLLTIDGIRKRIRATIALAEQLDRQLRGVGVFDLPVKPALGLVIFRARTLPNEGNVALLRAINATQCVCLSSVCIHGSVFLRVSISHPGLTSRDVDALVKLILKAYQTLESNVPMA